MIRTIKDFFGAFSAALIPGSERDKAEAFISNTVNDKPRRAAPSTDSTFEIWRANDPTNKYPYARVSGKGISGWSVTFISRGGGYYDELLSEQKLKEQYSKVI